MTDDGAVRGMRQLRIALVCEGGVSLAVYMHGLTKELHRLVKASRAFDVQFAGTRASAAVATNPFAAGHPERAYFEELRDLALAGREISVEVDIIAGTSAGGINGVFLANALAGGGDLTMLRDMWIRDGDVRELLNAPRFLGPWLQAVVAVGRSLRPRRFPVFPLHGDRMSRWLYDAMDSIAGSADGTLVPRTSSLQLLVTTTDLEGVEMVVASGAGGPSDSAVDHRQVLRFYYENYGPRPAADADCGDSTAGKPAIGDFTPGALAFAARATSAIQGAFPPVSADSFAAELAEPGRRRTVDVDRIVKRFDSRRADPVSARGAWCMDGGVLDNEPIELVVDAIAARPAQTEVVRRIVVLDPTPGGPLGPPVTLPPTRKPSALSEYYRAEYSVHHQEPIRRDLVALRELNVRISQIGAIAARQMDDVLAALGPALRSAGVSALAEAGPDVRAAMRHAYASADARAGVLYATYCRLRMNAAMGALADLVIDHVGCGTETDAASFVRNVLSAWSHAQPAWAAGNMTALAAMLERVDAPYARRQLQFVISGVNTLYGVAGGIESPDRADLDAIKTVGWALLGALDTARTNPIDPAGLLGAAIAEVFGPDTMTPDAALGIPGDWADGHARALTTLVEAYADRLVGLMPDDSDALGSVLHDRTASWPDRYRDALLSRYVGFPLWDALIFPITAWSELPQYSPIGVARWSPTDAFAVPAPDGHKLRGTAYIDFGAFLHPDWRRNDYLWGRLDGAELVLRTVRDGAFDRPYSAGLGTGQRCGAHLAEALRWVLDEEADLAGVEAIREAVTGAVATMPTPRQGDVPEPARR